MEISQGKKKEMDTQREKVNWTPWKQLLWIVFQQEQRRFVFRRDKYCASNILLLLRGSFIIEKQF